LRFVKSILLNEYDDDAKRALHKIRRPSQLSTQRRGLYTQHNVTQRAVRTVTR